MRLYTYKVTYKNIYSFIYDINYIIYTIWYNVLYINMCSLYKYINVYFSIKNKILEKNVIVFKI